jgi:peptidoglycan-N-acetylglucosamine deacetylase
LAIVGAPLRNWIVRALVTAAAGALVVATVSWATPLWVRLIVAPIATAAAVAVAYRVLPAFDPRGRVRWRVPPSANGAGKRCAITFDDGPTAATASVLDILAAEGVPATFFVLGSHVQRHPELVRRARQEGHAVGVHGMDHRKLATADDETIARQIDGVTRLLATAGVTAAPLYRTPHGLKSPAVFSVARRHGLTLWAWSRGVWDTDRPAPRVIVRRATRFARSGMVLLLHDGRGDDPQPDVAPMVAALPDILRELKRRGFAFVRLADV